MQKSGGKSRVRFQPQIFIIFLLGLKKIVLVGGDVSHRHGALRGRGDGAGVFGQDSIFVARFGRLPLLEPFLDLGLGQFHLQQALVHIQDQRVFIAYDGNRSAIRCFRCDVTHHKPVGGSREAAIGD